MEKKRVKSNCQVIKLIKQTSLTARVSSAEKSAKKSLLLYCPKHSPEIIAKSRCTLNEDLTIGAAHSRQPGSQIGWQIASGQTAHPSTPRVHAKTARLRGRPKLLGSRARDPLSRNRVYRLL